MAAIDKIYVSNSQQYKEFKEWCEAQPKLKDKYGVEVPITAYMYRWNDEDFDGERPALMAPYFVDAYIIRNCPLDYIQKELKVNYGFAGSKAYQRIKKGEMCTTPCVDFEYEKGSHFYCTKHPAGMFNKPYKAKSWMVDIREPEGMPFMWYSEDHNSWDFCDEFVYNRKGWKRTYTFVHSIRALKRLIRKWQLPVGTKVRASDRFDDYTFIVTK